MAFGRRRNRMRAPIEPNLTGVGQEQLAVQPITPIVSSTEGGISTAIATPVGGTRPNTGFGGRSVGGRTHNRPVVSPTAADQAGDMMPVTPETGGTETTTPTVGDLVGTFQEQADAARAANEERYAQGLGIHEELVSDFGQGGTMEAAAMQRYERQKQRDMATQTQQMVSSGLYGTTMPGTMAATYEEQVGTPYKLGLAEAMAQRKTEAMRGQAGFIERREDTPPDPVLMAGLVERASAKPEEDTTAGITEEVAPVSLWKSGQTGAITAAQFSAEAQRQHYSKVYTAQVPAYEAQIKACTDAAKKFDPGSPQQAHYAKLIEHYHGLLKTAKENVEKYSEDKAGVSSVQYAEEEQRQTRDATQSKQATTPSMTSVGRRFVGGRAGQTGPTMPSFASSGSGWGGFNR